MRLRSGLACLILSSLLLLSGVFWVQDNKVSSSNSTLSIVFSKKVIITTDAEGGSARPEVVATANRIFVLYLGNIRMGGNTAFNVKIYDGNLDNVIAQKTLVFTTTQYGRPTDIRVARDGQYLYAFYETVVGTTNRTTYLWGAKYNLDDNFSRVAYSASPIASSHPMSELSDGGELLDDPAPFIGPDSVFVITRIKYSLSMAGNTIYRVREFNKDLTPKSPQFDLNFSNVADGRARVTSLVFYNNSIYMAFPTTVSDEGINESVDDGAISDIILVKLRQDWTFDPLTDAKKISAEPNDRETYVSGFDTNDNCFYITHKQLVGNPPSGEQRAWLKVYDRNFNMVYGTIVRSTVWGPGGGEMRPSLEVFGNRVFSGQSAGESLGTGNAEVYVYELVKIAPPPDTTSPTISILSPENKTYTVNNIPLTFTVSESTSWIGYSLDGEANVTITGNTTLTGLSDETHRIVVYARDAAENTGSSGISYFTIDTTPPSISILSPKNKTYDTTSIPLTFTVKETVTWIGYSLDRKANVTIAGNTTLTGLSNGSHSLTVYANDTDGNTGASETIYFSIEIPPPEPSPSEPFPTWIVVIIVIIAVVGTAPVVYAKVKKTTGKAFEKSNIHLGETMNDRLLL